MGSEVITMMGPGFPYMDGSYMGWMMLSSLVFWVGVASLVVFAIVRLGRPAEGRGGPQAILDERLARGEIDAEEYRARRTLLSGR
jgi:putative membrane protein